MKSGWLVNIFCAGVFLLALLSAVDSNPQRMRIKTLTNITSDSFRSSTTPSDPLIFVTPLPNEGDSTTVKLEELRTPTEDPVAVEESRRKLEIKRAEHPKNIVSSNSTVEPTEIVNATTVVPVVTKNPVGRANFRRSRGPQMPNSHITVKSTFGVTSVPMEINKASDSQPRNSRGRLSTKRVSNMTVSERTRPMLRGRNRSFKISENTERVNDLVTLHETPPDVQVSQSQTKPILTPRRNSTGINKNEAGRHHKNAPDSKATTGNEIVNEKRHSRRKLVDQEVTTIPPKRFSSRYRSQRPGDSKTHNRGNHLNQIVKEKNEDVKASNEQSREILRRKSTEVPRRETVIPLNVPKQNRNSTRKGGPINSVKDTLETAESTKNVPVSTDLEVAQGSEEVETHAEVNGEAAPQKDDAKIDGGVKKHSEEKNDEHVGEHHALKGEKGIKDYKGHHHHEKGSKGHHDKEAHKGEYADEKGSKKAHKEGGGHFEEGHHDEEGKKEAEHEDKEEYKKGHSTKGGHVVHKKDEYEKKVEFYDEAHDGGEGEKFGAHFESYGGKKGGHKKGGHKSGHHDEGHKGKKGQFSKGGHYHEHKGHDSKKGEEKMYKHGEKYGKEGGKKFAKKYQYSDGKGKGKGDAGGNGGGGGKKHAYIAAYRRADDVPEHEVEHNQQGSPSGYKVEVEDGSDPEEQEDDSTRVREKQELPAKQYFPTSYYNARTIQYAPQRQAGTGRGDRRKQEFIQTHRRADDFPEREVEVIERERPYKPDEAEGQEGLEKRAKEKLPIKHNNAEFANEDGPTSFYTARAREQAERQDEQEELSDESPNEEIGEEEDDTEEAVGESHPGEIINKEDGMYLTEEELLQDKEGDDGFQVLHHLHEHDDEFRESPRSYRVAEAVDESQRLDTRVKHNEDIANYENYPVSSIIEKYKLPPFFFI